MPFCSKCGSEVKPSDVFCGRCGERQPGAGPAAGPTNQAKQAGQDPFAGIDNRTTSTLCYIPFVGWVPSIYVLTVDRFRNSNDVRFHAFQGLYLFVGWLVYNWVIESILETMLDRTYLVTRVVKLAFVAAWVYMMVQTKAGNTVRIPYVSDLADQSIAEQR